MSNGSSKLSEGVQLFSQQMKLCNCAIYLVCLAEELADKSLKWIIDLTIAYHNGKPLDIMTIFCATAPPCDTVFHYRCYHISEVMMTFLASV